MSAWFRPPDRQREESEMSDDTANPCFDSPVSTKLGMGAYEKRLRKLIERMHDDQFIQNLSVLEVRNILHELDSQRTAVLNQPK